MKAISGLPRVLVRADGASLDDAHLRSLSHVRVQQRASTPTLCELTFLDPPADASPEQRFPLGSSVAVGSADMDEPLFVGDVTALEVQHEADRSVTVRVRCYDRLHRLRKTNSARTFPGVTVQSLASQLVADLALSVQSHARGALSTLVLQSSETDFDVLRRVAEGSGLAFIVDSDTLHLFSSAGSGDAVPLVLGRSLWRARGELNADRAARSVTVHGWDARTARTHSATADVARSGRETSVEASASAVGGSDDRSRYDVATTDDEAAAAHAQALIDGRHADTLVVDGVTEGDRRIRPGTRVQLEGVGPTMTGQHVVSAVTHTIDDAGFLTEFDTSPFRRESAVQPQPVVTIGEVVDVDDPEKLGRVRVRLQAVGGLEPEWLLVALPGISRDKGLVLLPDVDDTVVVVFPHGDYSRGIVLGSVWTTPPSDGAGVVGGRTRRVCLATPGGHRLVLDDAKSSLTLEHGEGTTLAMDRNGARLHVDGDLAIEAPGHAITIAAATVDFRRRA